MQQTQNNLYERLYKYKGNVFQKPKRGTKEALEYEQKIGFNQKAKEKIQQMKKNIEVNTPRICGGIFLLFSLPQCVYLYKSIWNDYNDREFYKNLKKSVDWMNIKSSFFIAVIFGLEAVKFQDRKAQHIVQRKGGSYLFLLIPFFLNVCSISYFNMIDKKLILGSQASDAALLFLEAKLANEGLIPFWFFQLKYQIHIFDIFYLVIIYFSIKNLTQDQEKNPHKYILSEAK